MTYLSATYVEQFRCVGEACGAACCRGWSVQLTREDRARIELALANASPPLAPLTDEIVPDPLANSANGRLYVFRLNEQGNCSYVDATHRCQIHSTFGEAALPGICAQYPREVAEIGSEREMWAALSCPEAARLCLLGKHGADLVELPDVSGLRYVNSRLTISETTSDYSAYLNDVRRYFVELLSLKGYPLRTRLFFVAYFADRVSSYFNAEATHVDRRRLLQDMKAVSEPKLLESLAAEFDQLAIPGTYAIALVESIVKARSGLSEYPNPTLSNAMGPVGSEVASLPLEAFETAAWLQCWTEFCTRRLRWEMDFAPLLEQAFENYCKVFWLKDWYIQSPNLLVHASACMLRVAILRYRLFEHPELDSVPPELSQQERRTVLERVLLQVVTEVARALEHDRPFQTVLNEALAKRGLQDLAHASMLLVL